MCLYSVDLSSWSLGDARLSSCLLLGFYGVCCDGAKIGIFSYI